MKKILLLALILIFSPSLFAQNSSPDNSDLTQYGVRIEPDKRLIAVLATLEMARIKNAKGEDMTVIKTPLSAQGEIFRRQLQSDSAGVNEDLRRKINVFVTQYKNRHPQASDAEIVAPFVSMAFALSSAPDLSEPVRMPDLPGDLLEVLDFAPLVREFYRRTLSVKMDEYVKDYQKSGDDMRPSAVEMVRELLEYLHTKPQLIYAEKIKTQAPVTKDKRKPLEKVEVREHDRRFFIVPELLAAKGTINFLNIRDDYYAIVPPETDLSLSEARRAFLQFALEPLVVKNAKEVLTFREGIKALLDERRKQNPDISPDVFLAVLRSLVAAVDAREFEFNKTQIATAQARDKIDRMKTIAEKKAVSAELDAFKKSLADETALQLSEAYEKGAVLSFYFADQLKGSEEAGFDIAGSLRDMILSLDTSKETNRLAPVADARRRALQAREERKKNSGNAEMIIENPVTKKLLEIDKITQSKNYAESEKQLKQLLAQNPNESRIYYSLGRVTSLSAENITDTEMRKQRLLDAKVAYENVIRSATAKTDPALLSLTYVALARLYEYFGETAYAVKIYEAAMKFGDVTGGAYKEAVAAREKLLKEQ